MIKGTAPEQTNGGDYQGKVREGVFQGLVEVSSAPPLRLSFHGVVCYALEVSLKDPCVETRSLPAGTIWQVMDPIASEA